MRRLETKSLDADDSTALMKSITPDRCQQELQEKGGADFAIEFTDGVRFRTAVFKQKGTIGMVLRRIPNQFLSFEQIGMPDAIRSLIVQPRGLLLVTGPTRPRKTTSLASMINRIVDVLPKDQQDQIRTHLSTALIGVLSQGLLPRKPDGLVAAYEMMVVTPAIRNLIRENKTYRIDSAIQTGRKHGMFLLDESLYRLWKDGLVEKEEILLRSPKPAELASRIAQAEKGIFDEEGTEETEEDEEEYEEDYEDEDEAEPPPRRRR